MSDLAVIVLAAGQGTRMRSDVHKVLHPLAGRPMLLHLLAGAAELAPTRMLVVAGARAAQIEAAVAPLDVEVVLQHEQLGTGHAVLQARERLADFSGTVLVLYGDVPLVRPATLRAMLDRLAEDDAPAAVVLGFRPADPGAYGRIISGDGRTIEKMVEFKDADSAERAVTLCNSGLLAADAATLFGLLAQVGNDNAAGEYYLPDIVMLARRAGRASAVIETEAWEVTGVNSRAELAALEELWQRRRRAEVMAAGTSLVAPDTVFLSWDTELGRDVVVEPNVVFAPGVTVATRARIRAFSHLEGATVGEACEVGPYARLRPGTVLAAGVKIGNFVETKNAAFAAGAKANHLSYVGDATVGAKANIGAGTITCNYDGFFKYRTVIGDAAFIGSNSALVAPVTIGAGAIVGAGGVVTRDVEPDALALIRPEQRKVAGWASRFRERMAAKKAR